MDDNKQDELMLLKKVKDWKNSLSKSSKSRISLMESDRTSIQLAIYPKESLFSILPTFHVFFIENESNVDIRLLSYNETILVHETFSKTQINLRVSKILRLISSSILRLCSGLISNELGEDVIVESLSSKKVCRSTNCAYILTKKIDLCCQECLLLSAPYYFDEDEDQNEEEEEEYELKGDNDIHLQKDPALTVTPDPNSLSKDEIQSYSPSTNAPRHDADSEEELNNDANSDPLFVFSSSGDEVVEENESHSSCKSTLKKNIPDSSYEGGPKKYLECRICFSSFNSRRNLKVHKLSHENLTAILKEPCCCPICSEDISSKMDLNAHIQKVHLEKRGLFCCFICYKFIKNLANHLNGVHDTRTVICSKCGKTVKHRYYNEHLTHTHGTKKDRRVICPVCGKIICRMSNLSIHMKVMHSDESEKIFACKVCGKTFSHMKVLKKHLEVHQERKYKCKLCEYKTYRKSNVAVHLKKSHHMSDNVYSFVEDTSVRSLSGT